MGRDTLAGTPRCIGDRAAALIAFGVTHEMLVKVFAAMRDAPRHTYQILTKRSDRQREFMQWWVMQHTEQPPSNWWFGVSVESRTRLQSRSAAAEMLGARLRRCPLSNMVVMSKEVRGS